MHIEDAAIPTAENGNAREQPMISGGRADPCRKIALAGLAPRGSKLRHGTCSLP